MATWTLVPVRWRGVMLDGSPARGRITLLPSVDRFLVGPVSVFAALLTAELNEDGEATLRVPATDDPTFSVEGFTYEVIENLRGEQGSRYSIEVPLAYAEDGIDLNEYTPVAPSPGTGVSLVTRAEFDAMDSSIEERVETAIEAHTPGIELAYAERTTSYTSTATTATAALDATGFSITVVGTGRPVDIEFQSASVTHSVANTSVSVWLVCNGAAVTDPRSIIKGIASPSATPGAGNGFSMGRRLVLDDGVSYTFTLRAYAFGVAGTTTVYAVSPYMPMTLTATSR